MLKGRVKKVPERNYECLFLLLSPGLPRYIKAGAEKLGMSFGDALNFLTPKDLLSLLEENGQGFTEGELFVYRAGEDEGRDEKLKNFFH